MEFQRRTLGAAALACIMATAANAAPKSGGTSTPPRAVATFESIGLYWSPGANPSAPEARTRPTAAPSIGSPTS